MVVSTKLALQFICDEKVCKTILNATGEKKLDVEYLLDLVENILLTATDDAVQGEAHELEFRHPGSTFKSPSNILKKISCELMEQGDEKNVEKTVVAILNLVSSYSLVAKLVLSLAALATEFGELWRLRKDFTQNSSLPQEFCLSMAILKFESAGYNILDPKNQPAPAVVDELNNLILLILEVTKSMFELEKLHNDYTSADHVPGLLPTIQKHVYGTIASIVACAAQIYEGQPQDLLQWIEYLRSVHQDLVKHRRIYEQQKQTEVYWKLVSILKNPYHESCQEVVDILKLLISTENDPQLLHINDGSTTADASIDVLSGKDVLLVISSLDISNADIKNLKKIYEGIKRYKHYKMVWIPIVEQWTTSEQLDLFFELRDQMPWYVVQMFSSPVAGIKFIKEEWHFNGKPLVVLLNQQGEVENPNALPLIRLRGMEAFPFTKVAEDAIRNLDNWLHLLAKHIHLSMQSWIEKENYIFLYGGTDQHLIKKLQGYIKSIDLGKFSNDGGDDEEGNNSIESVEVGESETDFWTNIESLYLVKEDDETRRVLQKLLSNKTESGWAVLVKGSTVIISDQGSKISRALKKLLIKLQSEEQNKFHEQKFETVFQEYYKQVVEEFGHSCSHISIPISSAANNIPNTMKCLECGQVMETFITYHCNKNPAAASTGNIVTFQPRVIIHNAAGGHITVNEYNNRKPAASKPPPKRGHWKVIPGNVTVSAHLVVGRR